MLITILILYIIYQVFYTGYFIKKSETLVKKTYTGKKDLVDPKNKKFKLFIDGDSVGAGVGATSFETSVAGRIAIELSKKYYVQLENNSVSGSEMSTLINKKTPEEKQNLTVLIISSNDLFHFSNLKEFKHSTEKVLEKYSHISERLIIIGPGRVFDAGAIPFIIKPLYRYKAKEYANIISNTSKKYKNVKYVNPLDTKISKNEYGPADAPDGFHPNDEGHRFWFDLIHPYL